MGEHKRFQIQDVDDSVITAYKSKSGGVVIGVYNSIKVAAEQLGVSLKVIKTSINSKTSLVSPLKNETVSCRLTKRTEEMKFNNYGILVPEKTK